MNRFALPLVGFGLLLLVLIAGLRHAPEKDIIVSPLLGKSAPQFSLPGLFDDSRPLQSQALRGHWSVLNVWGTWCETCRAEHATLLQIKQQGKVAIYGIDWKDDDARARAWLTELGNPYERVGADREGRVAIDWGVYGAPETFLIDPAGTVVYKHVGALTAQIWQREFLSRVP
ncbi:MAG TPA: DsbE family thiol:disulfide interchange protein [Steroidobacteraceae bacterium]